MFFRSFKDVCRVLIEYGADSTLRDKDGDTPLTLAEDEAVKHLIQSTIMTYNFSLYYFYNRYTEFS